jgi:hypothetical protein
LSPAIAWSQRKSKAKIKTNIKDKNIRGHAVTGAEGIAARSSGRR